MNEKVKRLVILAGVALLGGGPYGLGCVVASKLCINNSIWTTFDMREVYIETIWKKLKEGES